MLQNKKIKQSGFTLVELLIVIVIIAILAAITIVAYNGIQNRAKTSSAQAAAETLQKKAEAANAIVSTYPNAEGGATATDFEYQSDSSLKGSGIAFTATATNGTAPTGPSYLQYTPCTNPANGGYKIQYYNYTSGTWTPITGGNCTTLGTALANAGPF